MRAFTGIEYGRAFFALAVVAWHAQALGAARVLDPSTPGTPIDLTGVLYLNVLVLAVPFFLAVSLFLYARRRIAGAEHPRRRIGRLVVLAVFWISVFQLVYGIGDVHADTALTFVLTGGHTVFYFLVELVLLTALTELLIRVGAHRRPLVLAWLLVASVLLVLLRVPLADALAGNDSYVLAYWSPLNFLGYVPAALLVLVLSERQLRPSRLVWSLTGGAYVVVAALEWQILPDARAFATDGSLLSPYGRPSMILGAAALLLAATILKPRLVAPAALLAELSLAVYCLHRLVLDNFDDVLPTLDARIGDEPFLVFLVVTALSFAFAYPLRRRLVV